MGLTVWAVHRIRPRYVSSVLGDLRWRWLLRRTLVLLPLFVPGRPGPTGRSVRERRERRPGPSG